MLKRDTRPEQAFSPQGSYSCSQTAIGDVIHIYIDISCVRIGTLIHIKNNNNNNTRRILYYIVVAYYFGLRIAHFGVH